MTLQAGGPSAPAALQARGLHVRRRKREVVSDVRLDLQAGDVLALIGPNGSGKTTLLKAVAGLIQCEGQVSVLGQSLGALDRNERARRIAYVPQQSSLMAPLEVRDVVAQGRIAHSSSVRALSAMDHRAIDEAMVAADITQFASRPYPALSHGERHRVLIARGLATEAPVLLLDEPTAGLDLEHVQSLLSLLQTLASMGRAVLVVLHPLAEVQEVANAVAVLVDGRIVANGPTSHVLTEELVKKVYNVQPIAGGAWAYKALL